MWRPPVPLNGLSLRDLLPEASLRGPRDARITGCSTLADACRPGDVFIAVAGTSQEAMHAAMERGIGAIVTSDHAAVEGNIPTFHVTDPQAALSRICQALAGSPTERLKVIGVAGGHGKTTTSCLLASILGVGGLPAGVLSTLAWFDGDETHAAVSPTLAPQALAAWLARMESNGCSHTVLEMEPSVLRSTHLDSVRFDSLCLTSLQSRDWRFDAPCGVVSEMEEHIQNILPPHGMMVVNADDPGCQALLERLQNPTLTVGIQARAEITAEIIEQTPYDQTFLLCAGSETIPVRTKLIGTHNVRNCLVAAAMALGYGLDPIDVVRGLERVEVISHRMQRIDRGQSFNVFVDAAHDSASLEAALRALHQATTGRVICVFACNRDGNDRFARSLAGRAMDKLADLAVVTSSDCAAAMGHDPQADDLLDPDEAMNDVADGFRGPSPPWIIADSEDAIRTAFALAGEGDSVVIAGRDASHAPERDTMFPSVDDRQIVASLLDEVAPPVKPFKAA